MEGKDEVDCLLMMDTKIPDGSGEVCVNGRIWRIISLNEESRRVAASGIPYCGHKLTMYVPQRSKKTGRMMYHNIGDYIKGEICYIPECAFTYEFYSKPNPGQGASMLLLAGRWQRYSAIPKLQFRVCASMQ